MLKIQRASAGSGKTYALAKNYIQNLIGYKNNKKVWKLRNDRQIEDALNHILAITFTNKATNEMKQRIVKNLSLLSEAAHSPLSNKQIDKIPYLREFQNLFSSSIEEIGKASEYALKVILNNYSLFKISTIDSFFQEILRTFTYEANLNDSYQLEIDSSYVSDAAIDSTMQELDTHPSKMGNSTFWLKEIIRDEAKKSQKWNPFDKKPSSRSVYSNIRKTLTQLESEDFKEIKESLDNYFNHLGKKEQLPYLYSDFKNKASNEREVLLKKIYRLANDAEDLILKNNYSESQISKNFFTHLKAAKELKPEESFGYQFNKIEKDQSVFLKKYRIENHPLDRVAMEIYANLKEWNTPSPNSFFKNWKIYGELIPYLGLILEVRTFLSKVLESQNIIQLSDTSYILKKIIGNDDAPFVYERLGNKIDHYLIDEFQDTSRMQWDIIYPLLNESEAKGEESLIIGDPKQSIYRFRNADHTLITKVVPEAFPTHKAAGFSIEDNTNWRSHTKIVKFNNYFFKLLASLITELSYKSGKPSDFNDLYSNVVQFPSNQEEKGYVEVRLYEKPIEETEVSSYDSNSDDEISKDWFESVALNNIGPLISSLLERGYHQKDIGILVNTNEKGKNVVEYLVRYNETLPPSSPKIDFISEESLLVSSSPAVELIIDVLKKIAQPGLFFKTQNEEQPEENLGEPGIKRRPYVKWNQMKVNYNIFSMQHSDLPAAQRIISFLDQKEFDDSISALLESLPTPSLTSIIESVTDIFLDEEMKRSEGLYISSLQDLVNEYCANHPNDPATFLEWWQSRGCRMSVSSPSGMNAVQIMTIHKSKGLEFKCVILPFVTDSFLPNANKEEWRWIMTTPLEGMELPPVLPIKTNSNLIGSNHEHFYKEYFDQVLTDKLNMFYVAFTRARNELYIFSKKPGRASQSISDYLHQILTGKFLRDDIISEEEKISVISITDLNISDDNSLITLGIPLTSEEIKKEYLKEINPDLPTTHYFKDYYINKQRPRLKSVVSRVSPSGEFLQD